MSEKDRIELFNRYLSKDLTPDQIDSLKTILKTENGRKEFKRFIDDTGVIIKGTLQMPTIEEEDAAISDLVRKSELNLIETLKSNDAYSNKSGKTRKRPRPVQYLFLACLGVAAALIFVIINKPANSVATKEELLVKSVARVTDFKGKNEYTKGQWLKPGEIKLSEGELELTFDSGAVLLLQGQSSLSLESEKRVFLKSGKLSAVVPEEAIGFIVNTPQGTVVDLGTEFGVSVDQDKAMEVHVIEGEVEAGSINGNEPKLLKKDEALRIEKGGVLLSETKFDQQYFTRVPERSKEINYNYIYWPFDKIYGQLVRDEGNGGLGGSYDLVLPDPKNNIKSGKVGKALYLSGKGEFAQSSYPGIGAANARTVAFWVKIPPNSVQKEAYSIVSWGKVAPSQKWQVGYNPNPDNGVVGAIRTEFSLGYVIGTTDLRDGRWHHVVSMFIGGSNPDVATHVRHYVDGKLEGVSGFRPRKINTNISDPDTQPVYLGKYINHDRWYFRGKIDEFFIFDGALTPYQISLLKNNQFK